MYRPAGGHQGKPKRLKQELVGAFETIRPLALHPVALAAGVRRRTDALQLLDSLLVSTGFRFLQERVIRRGIVVHFVRDLPRAHVGVEKFGPCSNHSQAKKRAERMSDDDNLVFAKMLPQILGQFDAVLRHTIDGHRRCHGLAGLPERSARAPLVPLHDGEVPFPGSEERERPGIGDVAWAAVQEQNDGIVAIFAANRDPLLDSADGDVAAFVDALCRRNRIVLCVASSQKSN